MHIRGREQKTFVFCFLFGRRKEIGIMEKTAYGKTRETLMNDMAATPDVSGIETMAENISILSYCEMTTDDRYCFYNVPVKKAAEMHCIDEALLDGCSSVRCSFSQKEYDGILGTRAGSGKKYDGVIMRMGENIIAPGTTRLGKNAMKNLMDITGYFQGSITDEFRNMYVAMMFIDIEHEIAMYYDEEEVSGKTIRPAGFVRVPGIPSRCSNYTMSEKEKMSRVWEEIRKKLTESVGTEKAELLMEGEQELKKHGRIHVMTVSPSELEILHMTGVKNGTYSFLAIDPRTCEMMFDIEKNCGMVRISKKIAERMSVNEEFLEKEGYLLMFFDDNGKRVLVKPGRGFTTNLCRMAGQKEKLIGGVSPMRDMIIAKGLYKRKKNKTVNVSVQELCSDKKTRVCRGIKLTSSARADIDFTKAFETVEREMMARNFSLKSWRRDGTDYTINFVFNDKDGRNMHVSAGKYDVLAGAELQISGEIGSSYRLCGVFYCGNSVFYCGDSSYKKGRKEHGAVYAQRKSKDEYAFSKLTNGFFYGNQYGYREDGVVSPWDYLVKQAGFEAGSQSIFKKLSDMLPSEETEEMFSIIRKEKHSRKKKYQIAKRIGKKQIINRTGSVYAANDGWTRLDTVMLVAGISENEKADISRRRMSMECLGEMIAAV